MSGARIKDLPIQKRSFGKIAGSFVDLNHHIKNPEITYVAEGIETALSIRSAANKAGLNNVQVLASLGKENLQNIKEIKTSRDIVLALDNGGKLWKKDQKILDLKSSLEEAGKVVKCIQPEIIKGKKTDFNDLAQGTKKNEINLLVGGAGTSLLLNQQVER